MSSNPVQHLFVLMLENRSFDHLLGFSEINGTDAATGAATKIDGLSGLESNAFADKEYRVTSGAPDRMPADPGHEFSDVQLQLCGPDARYVPGGQYPAIDNSGFAASYAATAKTNDPSPVMSCYSGSQLPVLDALAREFVVCDNWHASMPGPTWPNRMFVHAASSSGLDHSPTIEEIAEWETVAGFTFQNGTIFDALRNKNIPSRLYGGDNFPMVSALKNIHLNDIHHYSHFATDLAQPSYPCNYTFIEPGYDVTNDYKDGTSQHPLGDIIRGEALIKSTYEAIRASSVWETSLFIITWDEHGGFYDHATPPDAIAPGDTALHTSNNKFGFTFEKYGPRVPAVVISPLIPKNLVDHRLYDHASIPATIEKLFAVNPLTKRDATANNLTPLLTLAEPRIDTPATLPDVASAQPLAPAASPSSPLSVSRPQDSVNDGNLPGIVQSALHQDLATSPSSEWPSKIGRVRDIRTRQDAAEYLNEVQGRLAPLRPANGR